MTHRLWSLLATSGITLVQQSWFFLWMIQSWKHGLSLHFCTKCACKQEVNWFSVTGINTKCHQDEGCRVKMKLSFQQAICYLSFRWVNIHAWIVNSICISNHLSIQTWPLNPQVICITNTRLLACDVDENVLGLDENGITIICSWSLNQSVHRSNCLCM